MIVKKISEQYSKVDAGGYGKKNIEDSLAMLYHENSKFTEDLRRESGMRIARFSNPHNVKRSFQPFKHYLGGETIDLGQYTAVNPKSDFFELLRQRRSVRDFEKSYKISLYEIAHLLYQSYGVTQWQNVDPPEEKGRIGLRNVPAGGGLYPLELYIVLFNSHIESGLYHYRTDTNALELIKTGDFVDQLDKVIEAAPYVNLKSASCLILTTGMIERITIKYGERGYRFMMMEAGFVAQTISLLAPALGLGSCMLGGYLDDELNDFLGVDGVFETVNNLIAIGKSNDRSGNV